MPPSTRAYAAAHFSLELDEGSGNKKALQQMGVFRSIEGGGVKADVMTYQNGANYDRWRSLGKQKYEDIKLQVGMAMSEPFYKWIKDFFAGTQTRKNGAIVAADFHYNERARRTFSGALIKELTFPKLDATDKNPAYMNITYAVEGIKFEQGSGGRVEAGNQSEQKLWKACNFEFLIDGLDDTATKRVSKVDSFTIKQNILEYHWGGTSAPTKTPSQIDFPNLSFYVPEADAFPIFEHFRQRALEPKRELPKFGAGDNMKKSGQLTCFDSAHTPLCEIDFFDSEVVSITPDKSEAGSEEIKQVKVELWSERMTFRYIKPAAMPGLV